MNSERDEKKKPSYGLFMDDDINEEHKGYGFEDDLEKNHNWLMNNQMI